MSKRIDVNADLGEGAAHDAALLALISSANIACGRHAGDPVLAAATIGQALARGVAVGAHPSHWLAPDMGRSEQRVDSDQCYHSVLYQCGALKALVEAQGGRLHHVKPHGALYNQAARDAELAGAIARAVRDLDPSLKIYGLAGSELLLAAHREGLEGISEAFADRRYRADGSLVPRTEANALILAEEEVVEQALALIRGRALAHTGEPLAISAQSLCLHGDNPQALALARRLIERLCQEGVTVARP
ncbi:5-oxoprolinase subunit PxpA [Gallaecimonas sp. GXIMD4217]|uniref:5-oxoprolinase subunit PxpA n=1 Tax=Gallaecimonas sp. GXIMD4217 TaxID=3131927 RepID=UPI00311AC989